MERTLDDSANRRVALPEAFLCADGLLETLLSVTRGLVVYPAVIARRIQEELPFMATENILMAMVRAGADRQTVHEAIRVHSLAAAAQVKEHGQSNDLLDRLRNDPQFAAILPELDEILSPHAFIGRAPGQVRAFLDREVTPALKRWESKLAQGQSLRV